MPLTNRDAGRYLGDEGLTELPEHTLLNVIRIPGNPLISPVRLIARRFGYALVLILLVALIVYFDKGGYSEHLTFIDALYYSAVSLSTTGMATSLR